jgi:hypothetical protein
MRRMLTALTGAATAATMLTGAAAASAAGGHPASPRPAVTRTEQFQLMTTATTSGKASIIAFGSVFTAGGAGHAGFRVDKALFPDGTFKIRRTPTNGLSRISGRSCLDTTTEHGTYTLGDGTGKYAGITGHGKYRLVMLAVLARNSHGRCTQGIPPVANQQIIKAQGPASLP